MLGPVLDTRETTFEFLAPPCRTEPRRLFHSASFCTETLRQRDQVPSHLACVILGE